MATAPRKKLAKLPLSPRPIASKPERLTPLDLLNQDLEAAAALLTPAEVRYYCHRYYVIQDQRKRAASQIRETLKVSEPNRLLLFDLQQSQLHEKQIKITMLHNARSKMAGRWLLSIFGIGPVIAAGLLAHIDIAKAPNVGHIYNFAGLNSHINWMGRADVDAWVKAHVQEVASLEDLLTLAAATFTRRYETLYRDATTDLKTGASKPLTATTVAAAIARRPWNAALKVLCWKAGESFKKFSNSPKDTLYGTLYREYKVYAVKKNISGQFAELAQKTLAERKIADAKTLDTYRRGRLPDGRIDAWATRATTKILLSHLHHVLFELEYGQAPPMPFILAKEPLLHTRYMPPPNWPMNDSIEAEDVMEDE